MSGAEIKKKREKERLQSLVKKNPFVLYVANDTQEINSRRQRGGEVRKKRKTRTTFYADTIGVRVNTT